MKIARMLRAGVSLKKLKPFELDEKKLEPWQIKRSNWIKAHHIDKYYFSVYYNDMFDWALSWGLSIPTSASTPKEAIREFKSFLNREDVYEILEKFDAVPYPVRNEDNTGYGFREDGESNLDYYFRRNREIYNDFIEKLKDFNEYFKYFWVYDKCE